MYRGPQVVSPQSQKRYSASGDRSLDQSVFLVTVVLCSLDCVHPDPKPAGPCAARATPLQGWGLSVGSWAAARGASLLGGQVWPFSDTPGFKGQFRHDGL